MCPVQWRKPSPIPTGPQFLKCPPNRTILMLSRPSEHAVLDLHWSDEDKGSFPCLGPDECQRCHTRKFRAAYTGALVWVPRQQNWVKVIVDLGNPSNGLATTDYTGSPIDIGRAKESDQRSRLIYLGHQLADQAPPPPSVKSFDPRPSLLRRWGLYAEADQLALEPYVEQQRLQFPVPDVG